MHDFTFMQSLHDLSHLEIILLTARSRVSIVLFVACSRLLGYAKTHEVSEASTDLPKDGSLTGR